MDIISLVVKWLSDRALDGEAVGYFSQDVTMWFDFQPSMVRPNLRIPRFSNKCLFLSRSIYGLTTQGGWLLTR